jgi:hypothetical protein
LSEKLKAGSSSRVHGVSAKIADVVCAQNFLGRLRAKPILQVTVNTVEFEISFIAKHSVIGVRQEIGVRPENRGSPGATDLQ